MARIAGVDLPKNKRIDIALTRIFGIGRVSATKIITEATVAPETRTQDLTESQVASLRKVIDSDFDLPLVRSVGNDLRITGLN